MTDDIIAHLVARLVGPDADQADRIMAEALVKVACDITHENGTPEATADAYWSTITEFMTAAIDVAGSRDDAFFMDAMRAAIEHNDMDLARRVARMERASEEAQAAFQSYTAQRLGIEHYIANIKRAPRMSPEAEAQSLSLMAEVKSDPSTWQTGEEFAAKVERERVLSLVAHVLGPCAARDIREALSNFHPPA